MRRFILRRVGSSIVMLFLASILIFVLLRVLPGDPIITRFGARPGGTTEETIAALQAEFGYDRPLVVQYVDWIGDALRGDLGQSFFSQLPVGDLIWNRVPATVVLAGAALLLAILIAFPIAILAAMRPNSALDRGATGFVTMGMAVPEFWLGILLVSVFAVRLQWLPSRGYVSLLADPVAGLKSLALPTLTLAIVISAPIMRFLRSSLLEVMSTQYVRTAEGKGLQWRWVVIKHALPNALLPTITMIGLLVGSLMGGVVIIEWVFGWPGVGSLAVESIFQRDFAVLQSVVLLISMGFILSSLVVDLLYGVLNPRIRTAGVE